MVIIVTAVTVIQLKLAHRAMAGNPNVTVARCTKNNTCFLKIEFDCYSVCRSCGKNCEVVLECLQEIRLSRWFTVSRGPFYISSYM